jgi:hypothetical protein
MGSRHESRIEFWHELLPVGTSAEQLKKALVKFADFVFKQDPKVLYINVGFIPEYIFSIYTGLEKIYQFKNQKSRVQKKLSQLNTLLTRLFDFLQEYPDAFLYRLIQKRQLFEIRNLKQLQNVVNSRELYKRYKSLWWKPFKTYYLTVYYERSFVLDSLVVCLDRPIATRVADYIKASLQYLAGYLMYHVAMRHALRSAVAAIMARNMAHYGSHIEPGLQHRMFTFEELIAGRLRDQGVRNRASYYEKLLESLGLQRNDFNIDDPAKDLSNAGVLLQGATDGRLKARLLLNAVIDEAHRQLSYHRQRTEDLIARMATDWPKWGTGVDFYTFFIKPLMRNPLLLHFLNLSDDIGLSQTTIKYGWCERNSGGVDIQYANEQLVWEGQEAEADLVDIAINLAAEKLQGPPVRIEPSDPKSALLKSALVRVRDADIGVQAFFSFIEGVLRNAAKHRPVRTKEDKLELRIVLCRDWEEARALLDGEIQIPEDPKHCYAIISADQDVLEVNGKPRTVKNENNKDVPLLKFLQGEIKKPIIEESGEVASGTWGLKELKICAAFVSGANLDEVNSEDPNYVWVCKCPKGVWQDGKPRLAWVVRLEKPRYVLAVVNEKPGIAQDWEEHGVKFVTPDELSTTSFDYDFLYVSPDAKEAFESQRGHLKGLPQREVSGDSLNWNGVSPLDFVCDCYDLYLSRFINPNDNYIILLYFEDNNGPRTQSWNEWWQSCASKRPMQEKVEVKAVENSREAKEELYRERGPKKIAILRHVGVVETKNLVQKREIQDRYTIIYHQYATYSDPFFSFLCLIDPKELGPLFIRQLVESAVLNVLVIDERVAQAAISRGVPDKSGPLRLAEALYWMGIYVAGSVAVPGKEPFNYVDVQYLRDENSRLKMVNINDLTNGEPYKIENNFTVDLVLIHVTKLKEIANAMGISSEDLIEMLRKVKNGRRYVIVHSGRGKTKEDIPPNAPFLEYSIIQRYIIQEPSKFFLVQIALSAKEGSA